MFWIESVFLFISFLYWLPICIVSKLLAVGREAVLLFLGLGKKRTNAIELDNRMYENEVVPL